MTSEDIEQMKDEIAQLKAKLKGKNEEKEEGQKGAGASKKRRLSNETGKSLFHIFLPSQNY